MIFMADVITDEELEELMRQRGLEKLEEHKQFVSVDGTISTGGMQYKIGEDFNIGDYVSVYSKKMDKYFNLQITSISKTYSDGQEIVDIGFGEDRLSVVNLGDRRFM